MSQQTVTAEPHPLDRLTRGGWLKGLLRLGVGAGLLAVVLAVTGREALDEVLEARHAPLLALGAVLLAAQRVARVRKWAWLVEQTELIHRPVRYLLRVQFVGLLLNLVAPLSEVLKMWAVCRDRSDTPRVIETLTVDLAMLSGAAGVVGLVVGAPLSLSGGAWWLGLPGLVLAVAAAVVVGATVLRRGAAVRVQASTVVLSLVEALCLLGVYWAAMSALAVPMTVGVLAAVFPLLYMSHLIALTPSGLGLREAVFTLVFAGVSDTPTQTAAAVGLMVSAMQLTMTLVAGGAALAWPGRSLRDVDPPEPSSPP